MAYQNMVIYEENKSSKPTSSFIKNGIFFYILNAFSISRLWAVMRLSYKSWGCGDILFERSQSQCSLVFICLVSELSNIHNSKLYFHPCALQKERLSWPSGSWESKLSRCQTQCVLNEEIIKFANFWNLTRSIVKLPLIFLCSPDFAPCEIKYLIKFCNAVKNENSCEYIYNCFCCLMATFCIQVWLLQNSFVISKAWKSWNHAFLFFLSQSYIDLQLRWFSMKILEYRIWTWRQ